MDSRTRTEAALRLERPDRPPVGAWGHAYDREWSPPDLAAVTVDRARRYGWDFIKFQPRATSFAEALGGGWRYSGEPDQGPVMVKAAIEAPQDWDRLAPADAGAPSLADQVQTLARVVADLGPGVPVIQTVFSPITVATYLVGRSEERVLADLRTDRPRVVAALDRIADMLIDFARRSVEAGAAGIFYAVSAYASRDVMPLGEYSELALPQDRRVLDSLPPRAWFNVLHLCGPRLNFELSRSLPAQAVSWDIAAPGNPSLAEGREISGRAAMGGVGHKTTLVTGPPDAVAAEVRTAVQTTEGRGLLVAPGCSVPPGAPEANLRAMAEAVA